MIENLTYINFGKIFYIFKLDKSFLIKKSIIIVFFGNSI